MTETKPIGATAGHYQAVVKDTLVFDSHGYVKRMTDGGFNEQQAEALAAEQGDLLSNLATRQDMEAVRDDVETIKDDIEKVKDDIEKVKGDIERVKGDIEMIKKNMATKDELREVKEELEEVKKNMATKDDLKNFVTRDELKSEIAGLEARLVKWMVGSLFVFASLIIALG